MWITILKGDFNMSNGNLWKEVLSSLEKEVNKHIFQNYLKNTKALHTNEKEITIEVSSRYHQEYITKNLLPNIKQAINKIMNKDISILFNINKELANKMGEKQNTKLPKEKNSSPTPEKVELKRKKAGLNPVYTFNNFVVGSNNQFVYAAATAVSKNPISPDKRYNPLFIYGGVGLGKSHILNAIGNNIIETHSNLSIIYVTGEEFVNDIIFSITNRTMDKIRTKYRRSDILLIDDVHILSGKERCQEEFFHTFNTLYNAGKQIVLTSDRPPKEIPQLEERLRSRFQSGLLTDIGLPDIETREAIIYQLLKTEKVSMPSEVVHYIAKKIKYNIRDLKGVVINLIAQSQLLNQKIDLNLAKKSIKHMIQESSGKETTITRIQEVVSDYFGVDLKLLKSKKRHADIVLPRQVAMYIINDLTNASTIEIGNAFGKRDHSTVIHAIEKIRNLRQMDKELNLKIKKIIKELTTESL